MNYILAIDPSLSNTGICLFDTIGNPIKTMSIPTTSKQSHGERLKIIADVLLGLRQQYPITLIVLESGFSRHAVSTQVLYRVRGVIDYLFYDIPEICYAPSSIKKIICGNGRADKIEVQEKIMKLYPDLKFDNMDQSDSVGIGLSYFIEQGIIPCRNSDA